MRVHVRQGQHVRALAGHHAGRRDQDRLGGRRLAVHEPLEPLGRNPALVVGVRIHAGKRRWRIVAFRGIVADSEDGNLIRNPQADGVTVLADAQGHQVVVREDAQRQLEPGYLFGEAFGQCAEPGPRKDLSRPLNGD